MHDVALAIFWHQHQPYYPDDVGHENPMPWVRLHGTKDYWGMAMQLKEVPEFRAAINLVPSLLVQLLGYIEHGHEDQHLRVSRTPADALSEEDMYFLLDNFFMVHPDHMIRPYPRYHELYQMRGLSVDSAARAAKRFTKRDVLDLQCWSNLTWMHPIAFEVDKDLAEFRRKGRHWTEADKQWLLAKQMELLKQIIPLHRELAESGQIELTTTPFYHPILPLLCDKRLARQAMPDVQLPRHLEGYPEDAERHVRQAVEFHEKVFGTKPRGMWPSEGSVCQAIIPFMAKAGLEWIATDEEILSCSTEGWVSRDGQGFLRNPEMLYRPWRVEEKGQSVQIVFRDHAMSDQIGFHYQRYQTQHAVDDFIGKLEAIGRATSANAGQRPTLVSIILDGENCWEYYPDGGRDFLRSLYRRAASHPKITPMRIGDYVRKHPATDRIGNLFAGSWISHNFGIWIGHPECNRAWDSLFAAREHLLAAEKTSGKTPEQLATARRELQIAEGSDWFWWFGDSHSSAQDSVFDRLFRKHLQNIYSVLGDEVPGDLLRPISQGHRHAQPHTQPTSLLNVKVDGRRTYFEWINAGHFATSGSRGTMSMVQEGRLADVYFGFDTERLLLRIDARQGSAREQLAGVEALRIEFLEPEGFELIVSHPGTPHPAVQLYHHDVPVSESGAQAAADHILEIALPTRSLGVTIDDNLHFRLDVFENDASVERIPAEGAIETTVPSPEFEMIMWQA
ncbi:MAG TPA: glycoside hydrolase family 57 protein [Pirellulales bacterium]|jgi:alpha-amylase/alpha-mannosidase (GH57 family)|nr:glycoside hydrolase family 57 protein [Pirellulales bacterium]